MQIISQTLLSGAEGDEIDAESSAVTISDHPFVRVRRILSNGARGHS